MKTSNWILIIFNLAYMIPFSAYFIMIKNYEFLIYVAQMVILLVLISSFQSKLKFSKLVLWMLSIWGILHMAGGGLQVNGNVLYRFVLLDLFQGADQDFIILKFDQVLHFYIYFIASIALYEILSRKMKKSATFLIIIVLASMGLSVINELVEFLAVVLIKDTGVGGYYNTLLDLCFNTLGAISGVLFARKINNNNA